MNNLEKKKKKKAEVRCEITDKILAIFEENEVTQHELEIIMENVLGVYKHFGILKKGVHVKK